MHSLQAYAYLKSLLLLHSPFMLSVVKMLLKGNVGAHALKKSWILRAILCKYGASYIGTISRSDLDFDETC